MYPGSLGTVLGAQGQKDSRRKHWICANLTKAAGHQMASTIKILRRKPLILRGKSHRSIGEFMGVNLWKHGQFWRVPADRICIASVPISATPRFGAQATTRPPDPTLPSRAHHKDYVSRTTSSNHEYRHYHCYYLILLLFLIRPPVFPRRTALQGRTYVCTRSCMLHSMYVKMYGPIYDLRSTSTEPKGLKGQCISTDTPTRQ